MDPAVQLLTYILTLVLMISAQFGIPITDIAEKAGLDEEMQAIIQTEEERKPAKPFPELLYPSETDEIALGSWRVTVRSAITDLHCDFCQAFTKKVEVNLYVRHTESVYLSPNDIISTSLEGNLDREKLTWRGGGLYSSVAPGLTKSESVSFTVPLEATDFVFELTTCDPNDRWSFSCDRQHAPAQPIKVRVNLGPLD